MKSELRALADLIVQQVDIIEATCAEQQFELPSLDQAYSPESEVARQDPRVAKAITLLNSATNQMGLLTRSAGESVLMKALGVRDRNLNDSYTLRLLMPLSFCSI